MNDRIKAPAPFEITLSFEREPAEHVAVMFAAARRFQGRDQAAVWRQLAVIVGFAVLLGIVMELHRRFILPVWLGRSDFATFGQMVFYFLPAFILFGAMALGALWWSFFQNRARLMAHVKPKVLVGMDLSRLGMKMTTDDTEMFVHWSAIRHMELSGSLILMDAGTFTLYIPERAFDGRKAFVAGFHQIQTLWRHGMEDELESRGRIR